MMHGQKNIKLSDVLLIRRTWNTGHLSSKSFKSLFVRFILISFLLTVLHAITQGQQKRALHSASQSVADKG